MYIIRTYYVTDQVSRLIIVITEPTQHCIHM